jgi:hypothetical protein
MAQLLNPNLSIELISGTSTANCTANVDVELTPFELFLINAAGLVLQLRCTLMGADGGATGDDDFLFRYPSQIVPAGGGFTFPATVSRSTLDEDSFPAGNDEVYAQFTLESAEPAFPLNVVSNSPEISGDF